MEKSKRWKLNKEDGLKILKGAGIAAGGGALTYLATVLIQVDFGQYAMIAVPLFSFLINAGVKWLKGKK